MFNANAHHFQLFVAIAFDQLIWMLRNKVRLNQILNFDTINITTTISRLSLEHLWAWRAAPNLIATSKFNNWRSLAYRLQYDVAVRSTFSMAPAICLDELGNIMKAQTKLLPDISDPLSTEAHAARLAAILARSQDLNALILEGNSSVVTAALQRKELDMPCKNNALTIIFLNNIYLDITCLYLFIG